MEATTIGFAVAQDLHPVGVSKSAFSIAAEKGEAEPLEEGAAEQLVAIGAVWTMNATSPATKSSGNRKWRRVRLTDKMLPAHTMARAQHAKVRGDAEQRGAQDQRPPARHIPDDAKERDVLQRSVDETARARPGERHHLGDGEETDDQGYQVDARPEVPHAEGEAVLSGVDIRADKADQDAEGDREKTLAQPAAGETSDNGEAGKTQHEHFRRTKLQGEGRQHRREEQQRENTRERGGAASARSRRSGTTSSSTR